jgi:spermidine synthase
MRIALAAVGFTSMIAQVLLMRELVATLYGNELILGLILMAWLAWVAVGSGGLERLPIARRLGTMTFALGLSLAGVLLLAQITVVRALRTLLGVTPGAFIEFGPMLVALILILAPVCLLTGFLFTLGARLMVSEGGAGARAYVWESLGAVAGGILFSFVLIFWLNPFQTALLVAAVDLTVAGYQVRGLSLSLPAGARYLFLFAILALVALPAGRFLQDATLEWQWPDLVFAADSPYGRLVVQARDGQRVFFQNGLLAFETQGTFAEEVAHFPLLVHPDPRNILLIGGGVAGDLREILKHPGARVTYAELDPLLIQTARAHLAPEDAAVLDDPRVSLILADGRLFVKQWLDRIHTAASQAAGEGDSLSEPFDVIILDLPEPSTGGLNRFYTREFFAEIRAILKRGGVFALGLPSAENYWNPELARRNGSIYHTLRVVFPEVLVLPGEHNFFLASDVPLESDPAVLSRRLEKRGVPTRWVTPEYIKYAIAGDRFIGVRQELEMAEGVRLNQDLNPICYYYNLAVWLARFYPNLSRTLLGGQTAGKSVSPFSLAWLLGPLVLGVALARWRRSWAVPLAMGAIGLVGMVLQVVVLFAFQVLHGYVYAEVSLIVTAFMAGLALGAAGVMRRPAIAKRKARRLLISVQLAIAAYCGLFPFILGRPVPSPALLFPGLALLAGALGGAAFPLALALAAERERAGSATGILYAADLAGGCLGALLGAVIFVPVLGIPQTCLAIALIALAGALAL